MTAASINDVLDRLPINYREIAGVVSVARLAESLPKEPEELPYVYTLVGATTGNSPSRQAGHTIQRRQFVARCLVDVATSDDKDDSLGSESMSKVITAIDAFNAYFLVHPRLDTAGTYVAKLRELAWMPEDVLFGDSGPRKFQGPGGTEYVGFDFNLTIALLMKTGRSS